jgi:quercetin dioxygenase-like cupin family protein
MAIHHALPGEIVDLSPLGAALADARTTALVKAKHFEAIRMIVRAGMKIPSHGVEGETLLHCLEGRITLGLKGGDRLLAAGDWVYLMGGEAHSLTGVEDAQVLLTILFNGAGG